MKPVLSLLFLVAAPTAACTTLVPLARPVYRHQHVPAVSTHHLQPFFPAPSHTTAPCPLQQFTPPSKSRTPPTPHSTRPPFLSRETDVLTAPPTPATPYPTPHTFRSTSIPSTNHRHILPPHMYFHIPVHIHPFMHPSPEARTAHIPRPADALMYFSSHRPHPLISS